MITETKKQGELKKIGLTILKKYISLLTWLEKKAPTLEYVYPTELYITKEHDKYLFNIIVDVYTKGPRGNNSGNLRIVNIWNKYIVDLMRKHVFISDIHIIKHHHDVTRKKHLIVKIK